MSSSTEILGKVCLITGATGGIGLAAARGLAQLGAVVIGVGRDRDKCLSAMRALRRQTNNPNVEFLMADLSSLKEVRKLAEEFQRRYPRLDVLVNNVGGVFLKRQETADHFERTFGLNYLSPFLLTHLVLEQLKANAQPQARARIINVASAEHARVTNLGFNDLQSRSSYNPLTAYRRSKLGNVLFTYELARRLGSAPVTVNALHPGLVATNLWGHPGNGRLGQLVRRAIGLVALAPEAGARTIVHLAASPSVEGVTGKYFDEKQKMVASSKASYDPAAQFRLWLLSEQLTGLAQDEI